MDLMWIIYFIDVLTVGKVFIGIGSAIAIFYVFVRLLALDEYCPWKDFDDWPNKLVGGMCSMLLLYGWLIPSEETAYKMLAAYGVTEIVNNEDAKRLGGKSLEVLESAMDEYLSKDK